MTRAVVVLIWLALAGFQAVRADTAVLAVRHRLPEELVRVLGPLLEEGEHLVAVPDGLWIQAPPARIGEIRALVARLDRRPRRLVISVWQTDRLNLEAHHAGVDAVLPADRRPEAEVRVYGSRSVGAAETRQSIQTLEGEPAFIAVGQERPVPFINLSGSPPVAVGGIGYRPVTSGFRVTPRMVGCRVRLTVAPWSERLSDEGDGSLEVQAAATTLETEAGQWVELGAHTRDGDVSTHRILAHRYRTDARRMRIFVRVDAPEGCD